MKPLKELIEENAKQFCDEMPEYETSEWTGENIYRLAHIEETYKKACHKLLEELSKSAGETSMKCFMKSKQGENDYLMFINEHPEGGFKWSFLDYEPDNIADYTPIYITREDQSEIIQAQRLRIEELEGVQERAIHSESARGV